MIPSPRLAAYFALGTILWLVAALASELVVVAALYDVVLLFVAVMDLILSPQPRDFEIERQVADKMNLGVKNPVRLSAHSRANAPITLTIRDEPPATWPVESEEPPKVQSGAVVVPPVARVTLETVPLRHVGDEYFVIPTRRGRWQFGALSARYPTRLKLWHRQFRRAPQPGQETTVQVYPDTGEVRRYELLLRESRLRELGLHVARMRGRGTEFESLRDYTSDDNYKDINWKASARRGKWIATQYEIERDQTIMIALDCGRMMTALAQTRENRQLMGAAKMEAAKAAAIAQLGLPEEERPQNLPKTMQVALSKLDCAINATVLLSHVSASMGDAVGVLLFADTVLGFVPPRKGRLQTGTIIEALYAAQPTLVEPDYIGAYHYLLSRKIRRSLVVTFTDLIDPDASRELLQASGALRRHHNALCVTINNRDVMDMAEQMPQRADDLYAKAMAQRMLSQRAGALEELRRRGVGILDVEASQLSVATVNRYLDLRSRATL